MLRRICSTSHGISRRLQYGGHRIFQHLLLMLLCSQALASSQFDGRRLCRGRLLRWCWRWFWCEHTRPALLGATLWNQTALGSLRNCWRLLRGDRIAPETLPSTTTVFGGILD